MEHPHLVERGTVRTVTQRGAGTFKMPGMPLRFAGYPAENELEAPYKGEHNSEILEQYLDYSPQQIADLMASGVLVDEDIPSASSQ
jgi:crotonobetainyl-CoA:carnitine CoA-transferase CaiB-like acyl-CoA transferase